MTYKLYQMVSSVSGIDTEMLLILIQTVAEVTDVEESKVSWQRWILPVLNNGLKSSEITQVELTNSTV